VINTTTTHQYRLALQRVTSGRPCNSTMKNPSIEQDNSQDSGQYDGQWAAFVNPPYLPYAPALANAGIDLERFLIINTDTDNDTLWATEQLLRAGLFASVVGWVNRTTAQKQRRLQLAAELGKTWATIYRPASAQDQHSPAALRIVVSAATGSIHQSGVHSINDKTEHGVHIPASYHMNLDIIKSRGGKQHSVQINPQQFDYSQGVEWPAMPPDTSSALTPLFHEKSNEQDHKQSSVKINPVIRSL